MERAIHQVPEEYKSDFYGARSISMPQPMTRRTRILIEIPEGTVLDLVVDDEGDDLTDEDRRALHAAVILDNLRARP